MVQIQLRQFNLADRERLKIDVFTYCFFNMTYIFLQLKKKLIQDFQESTISHLPYKNLIHIFVYIKISFSYEIAHILTKIWLSPSMFCSFKVMVAICYMLTVLLVSKTPD